MITLSNVTDTAVHFISFITSNKSRYLIKQYLFSINLPQKNLIPGKSNHTKYITTNEWLFHLVILDLVRNRRNKFIHARLYFSQGSFLILEFDYIDNIRVCKSRLLPIDCRSQAILTWNSWNCQRASQFVLLIFIG